jgi:hypothetical protein
VIIFIFLNFTKLRVRLLISNTESKYDDPYIYKTIDSGNLLLFIWLTVVLHLVF